MLKSYSHLEDQVERKKFIRYLVEWELEKAQIKYFLIPEGLGKFTWCFGVGILLVYASLGNTSCFPSCTSILFNLSMLSTK